MKQKLFVYLAKGNFPGFGVDIQTTLTSTHAFLGYAHERMCKDFGVSITDDVQSLIQRLRVVAGANPGIAVSKVQLVVDPHTQMGNGLVANPLTFRPDPALGVKFGTVPDQVVIGEKAAIWKVLKRRSYEERGVLTKYGGKPHYVLAHLLNHNLNGAGNNPLNVVPFWAAANTLMSSRAERYVKELVLRGVEVNYTIQQGEAVGLTPERQKVLDFIDKMKPQDEPTGDRAVQKQLVMYEQFLPKNVVINCDAKDKEGWKNVVSNVTIENYVPLTVPHLRPVV